MSKKCGFSTEIYDDDYEIEVLITGDGKTAFTDLKLSDGSVGVCMSYESEGVSRLGKSVVYTENETINDINAKWLITFDNEKSIDALIKACIEAKGNL